LGEFVDKWLIENVPVVRVLDFEEWLETTTYTEARKDELREAHDSLKGGVPDKHTAAKINSFVKTEGYDVYKHARLINSRGDAFKVFSGPAFKAIEEVIYQNRAFVKHTPVRDRPALVKSLIQAGRRYYATDFTAFESHFVPLIMETLEMRLYRHCLQGWKGYNTLHRTLTGWNKLHTRTGVHAKVKGRRMSGEMCTSLGNGFSNLMLALFIAQKKGGQIDGFVEGDDGLFASTVPLCAKDYEELGFTIKITEVIDPCTASFCGMVFGADGHIMPDPRHFLANFTFTSSFIHAGDRVMKELLRAKALSTLYETPACPIVSAVARRALRDTRGSKARFVHDGYHETLHVPRDERGLVEVSITLSSRELFESLYGISIATQLAIEKAVERGKWNEVTSMLPPTGDMLHYYTRYVEAV